jgi:hypothetical protein
VTVIFLGAGYLLVSAANQIRRGSINKAALLYFAIAMPLAAITFAIFLSSGLLDTILARFEYDFGSAFSRQVALDLLSNMSEADLWFGLSANDVASLVIWQGELGLIAIEISWVNFILVCGLVFTIPLFITYVLFLFRFLPKYCGLWVCFPSLHLLVVTSASNGIWAKTTILSTSLVIIISFMRRDDPRVTMRRVPAGPFDRSRPLNRTAADSAL